jgi:membrane-bound lytic murein transglycosylase D
MTNLSKLTIAHRATWIAASVLLLILSGCGRPIVDPGRSTTIISPPTVQPAAPASSGGLPTLESPEIERVPAESVLRLPNESEPVTYHAVQAGETLATVAKKYGVSVEQLRTANGLDRSSSLKVQQLLFIPRTK